MRLGGERGALGMNQGMRAHEPVGAGSDLETLAETIPQMVWATRADGYHEYYNRRWYEYTGLTQAESFADGWSRVLHPEDYARSVERWQHSLDTFEPYDIEYRFRRYDGVYRWFFGSARPVRDAQGSVHWYGTCTDIEERVSAEQTLQFLLDAYDVLGNSLDIDRTLEALGGVIVPRLAEWCILYLRAGDGGVTLRFVAHEDPALVARAREIVTRFPPARAGDPIFTVLQTGESILYPTVSPELLGALVQNDDHHAAIEDLGGISSGMMIPLRSAGAIIGVLQLLNSTRGRVATNAQRRIAESLAARASIALDNARLFERERQIAGTFQNAALPAMLPTIQGLLLDAVYEPGSSDALVGGDWYDALRLRDGRLIISVGDVAGSGLQAAVTMQAMRQALRTIAHVYADPVTILDAADRTLRNESPDRIVTAFVGLYDPIELELRYALAGHPPPLVRHADGTVESFAAPGLPLGLREPSEDVSHVLPIEAGELIVLYTDGVIEATRDVLEGERRLREAVAATTVDTPYAARRIASHSLAMRASDDVALLTLSIQNLGDDIRGRWSFASDDADGAHAAQHAFCRLLEARRSVDPALLYAAELVFSELVGNVVRYAPGGVEIVYEELVEPVLHVLDRGPGFVLSPHLPSDILAERGRGLYLAWSLTAEINVSRRTGGGSHARAVLRVRS
ncbi:MAG: hypothetical protein NVS2B17_21870 [Candidatus Velthaea sp.]